MSQNACFSAMDGYSFFLALKIYAHTIWFHSILFHCGRYCSTAFALIVIQDGVLALYISAVLHN
ncbi:hypothetical protein T01_5952 [Trichinella spiralis]|uniref:Uncharacterized protein n=1 Tax=Trichinella spiralis TaxID=6334 RepID=A0A0V1AJA4_TRISP|nr:hypothetical protein T01_5952 [Trichinella spiralis]